MVERITPLVTIGMPCFNNETTVATAIQSILGQSYGNWELLILDDGSNDESRKIAESFQDSRIKVIADGVNRGRPKRRNQAAQLGQGDYYACMDADDLAFPERIARQVAFLQEHQFIDLVGTGVLVFERKGQVNGSLVFKISHEEICSRPWAGITLAGATFMGRREWFLKNPYREDLTRVEDQELLLRTYRSSRFACIPELLYGYRVNQLDIGKVWLDRYILGKELLRNAARLGDPLLAIRAIGGQVIKAVVDAIAIGSGLGYRMLRHRAIPVPLAIVAEWQRIWLQCSKGEK